MNEETPVEKAEKARVRRRWLTLGELLAITAVAISALTFWNSYRERTDSQATRAIETAKASRTAATLILQARADREGDTLALAPRLDSQSIQTQTLHFPKALGLAPVETSGNARIERGWIEDALIDAREKAKAPEKTAGDARLPAYVVTNYLVDGEPHVDRALYEIGYATRHSLLGGTSVRLRGLSRNGGVADDAAGAKRADARWAALIK